jgi:hypothetical protein
MVHFYEYDNAASVSIKCGEVFDETDNCQPFKMIWTTWPIPNDEYELSLIPQVEGNCRTIRITGRAFIKKPYKIRELNCVNHSFINATCRSLYRLQTCTLQATGWTTDGPEFRVPVESGIFSSPQRQDRVWDPPRLLSSGYRGPFPEW